MSFNNLYIISNSVSFNALIISNAVISFPNAFPVSRFFIAFSIYDLKRSSLSSYSIFSGFPLSSIYSLTYSSHRDLISLSLKSIFLCLFLMELLSCFLVPWSVISFIFLYIALDLCFDSSSSTSHLFFHHSPLAFVHSFFISFFSWLYFSGSRIFTFFLFPSSLIFLLSFRAFLCSHFLVALVAPLLLPLLSFL